MEIIIWSFKVLLLKLIRWYQNSAWLKSPSYSPLLARHFWKLTYTSWIMKCLSSQPRVNAKWHSLYPFREFFPQPQLFSSHTCTDHYSAEYSKEMLCTFLYFSLCSPLLCRLTLAWSSLTLHLHLLNLACWAPTEITFTHRLETHSRQ